MRIQPTLRNRAIMYAMGITLPILHVACEKQQSLPTSPATSKPVKSEQAPSSKSALPSNHPPIPADTATNAAKPLDADGKLKLSGIVMHIPEGWVSEAIPPRPMAPVAVFRLPARSQDLSDCTVRVTYFPGMKGMDDRNIDRWLGQFSTKDGKTVSRDDAKIEIHNAGKIRITTLDVTGTMRMSSGMPGEGNMATNSRLIAAILDHPKGPHFIKASGEAASIENWESIIKSFLTSAQVK